MQVVSWSWSRGGTGPDHVIELLTNNPRTVGAWAGVGSGIKPFCQPDTKTTPKDIALADTTLKGFLAASSSAQFKAAAAMLEGLPANVIAHRFGDFVLTYHGASLNPQDPQLWVVAMIPDRAVNGTPASRDPIFIGHGDCEITQITFKELPAQLTQQNAYRASIGLPALPDLTTVTHDNPAVAAPLPESDP